MNNNTQEQLKNAFQWRYATKSFDPSRKIPADVWATLEQSLVQSPSSYGLQPYRFLVVNDPAKRAALLPNSWGQGQVVDASHYVVFAAKQQVTASDVDRYLSRISNVRKTPVESLAGFRQMLMGNLVNSAKGQDAYEWTARQAYIAFGNLMTAAALLQVDACPIEGLDPAAYDKILGLEGTGYATVAACALGYRSQNDRYAALPKVRFETKDLVLQV